MNLSGDALRKKGLKDLILWEELKEKELEGDKASLLIQI